MRKTLGLGCPGAIVVATVLISHDFAYGYLDPGTGSYLFQVLLAGFLGVIFTVKLSWQRTKGFFARLLHRERRESR